MIMPHIKFRRVVTSGEGTKSQSGQGSQSSVESIVFVFFQLGGKFMGSFHGIISCTFSCAWNRSLKMQGVSKESWGLCLLGMGWSDRKHLRREEPMASFLAEL